MCKHLCLCCLCCWGPESSMDIPPSQLKNSKKSIEKTEPKRRSSVDLTTKRINKSPEYQSKKLAIDELYQVSSTPTFIEEKKMTTRTFEVPDKEFDKEVNVFAFHGYDPLDLTEIIGGGTYGKVFKGVRLSDGEKVAIKRCENATAEKKFLYTKNEIFALMKVNHPNVVKLYDHFIINNDLYLIMEFIDGETLKWLVKHDGAYTENQAKVLLKQMIEGLKHVHDLGIAHRDIKLDNVMLSKSGQIKLTDFGLSRVGRRKKTGIIIMTKFAGTPSFMAPEVIDHVPYDAFAADVWSLGVCLYMMVNRKYPFPQNKTDRQLMAQKEQDFPLTTKYTRTKASLEFIDLIKRLLQPEVSLRITLEDVLQHPWFTGANLDEYKKRMAESEKKAEEAKKKEEAKKVETKLVEAEKKVEEAKKVVEEVKKEVEEAKKVAGEVKKEVELKAVKEESAISPTKSTNNLRRTPSSVGDDEFDLISHFEI